MPHDLSEIIFLIFCVFGQAAFLGATVLHIVFSSLSVRNSLALYKTTQLFVDSSVFFLCPYCAIRSRVLFPWLVSLSRSLCQYVVCVFS